MASLLPDATGPDWASLPLKVSIKSSNRAFYGKYLYSVNWRFAFAHLLREWRSSSYDIERRISSYAVRSQTYRWVKSIEAVRQIYQILKTHDCTDMRFRVEGSYITFFSNDEHFLHMLTKCVSGITLILYAVVCRPKSSEHATKLMDGCVNSTIPYKYKAVTRHTSMEIDEKLAILNILEQDGHKINDRLRRTLSEQSEVALQSHFYTNDMKVMTLISLIHPMFIKKIHTIISE